MTPSLSTPVVVTLVGDVISSREIVDQASLFEALDGALERVNRTVPARQPLRLMTGDEFQGVYETLESALRASLLLHLHLLDRYGLRIGLGRGEITVDRERAPSGQSGPGWWFAREAIDEVKRLQDAHGWPRSLRTRFQGPDGAEVGLVNALLICRDQVLSRMDRKDARIALGLFAGETQVEMAGALGITQSTVSSRQRAGGPSALVRAQESLDREAR